MEPLLRIVDLHKSFGSLEVLKGIEHRGQEGREAVDHRPERLGQDDAPALRQPLEKPTSGHVYVDGTLIGEKQVNGRFVHLSDRELARERAEIGFVFQRFNLFPHLSALDNVTVAPRRVLGCRAPRPSSGRWPCSRRSAWPTRRTSSRAPVGRPAAAGGDRPRAMQPKLMLFDEATSALDRADRRGAESDARARRGRAHDADRHPRDPVRGRVSDRVIFMDGRQIVEEGPPTRIFKGPRTSGRARSCARSWSAGAPAMLEFWAKFWEWLPEILPVLWTAASDDGQGHDRRAGRGAPARARGRADADLAAAAAPLHRPLYTDVLRGTRRWCGCSSSTSACRISASSSTR